MPPVTCIPCLRPSGLSGCRSAHSGKFPERSGCVRRRVHPGRRASTVAWPARPQPSGTGRAGGRAKHYGDVRRMTMQRVWRRAQLCRLCAFLCTRVRSFARGGAKLCLKMCDTSALRRMVAAGGCAVRIAALTSLLLRTPFVKTSGLHRLAPTQGHIRLSTAELRIPPGRTPISAICTPALRTFRQGLALQRLALQCLAPDPVALRPFVPFGNASHCNASHCTAFACQRPQCPGPDPGAPSCEASQKGALGPSAMLRTAITN